MVHHVSLVHPNFESSFMKSRRPICPAYCSAEYRHEVYSESGRMMSVMHFV